MRASLVCAMSLAVMSSAYAQDASGGKDVFRRNCSICHSPNPGRNLIGPSLFGVVNRRSGQAPNYPYSQANKGSGITWSSDALDRYLNAPQQMVKGTNMTFPGLHDPKQRADVIAYLSTLR